MLPFASSASTVTYETLGSLIWVSNDLSGTVSSICIAVAESPARTRQDATFVAPFQLTNNVVPWPELDATIAGGDAGTAAQGNLYAR